MASVVWRAINHTHCFLPSPRTEVIYRGQQRELGARALHLGDAGRGASEESRHRHGTQCLNIAVERDGEWTSKATDEQP